MKTWSSGGVIAKLIAATMLIAALAKFPYAYYILMRWIVCGVATHSAYQAVECHKNGWAWALGLVALVFNPIIPVHLGRDLWAVIDIGVATLLLVSVAAGLQWRQERGLASLQRNHCLSPHTWRNGVSTK